MNDKREKSEPDASERLVQAEGADSPHRARTWPAHKRSRPARVRHRMRVPPLPSGQHDEDGRPSGEATPDATQAGRSVATNEEVAARIRELEERLDRMIVAHAIDREPSSGSEEHREHREAEDALARPPATSPSPAIPHERPEPAPSARDFLSTDFYLRKWGRLGLRNRSQEVDEFGHDPVYEQKVLPLFEFLYRKYFRVETHGVERIPADGRCLLVANHSGTLPVDGMMLRLAVRREHPRAREVRWLAEDAIFHFPFLGSFTNRLGAVRACQENAERLLDHGALVAVFPEGMKGIGKLFRDRYKLARFGRGGFVKLCLRTRTPIVPVAIVGSEETNPLLGKIEYLTRAFGVPYVPITPTFPLLGPAGLLPAPTKWKIYFGEPTHLDGYGAEAADDELLVGRLAERVRGEIQAMLDRAIAERRSVWFG
jgi:1-acyl-sn-glycerol-3-phosphate acyltransferase